MKAVGAMDEGSRRTPLSPRRAAGRKGTTFRREGQVADRQTRSKLEDATEMGMAQ